MLPCFMLSVSSWVRSTARWNLVDVLTVGNMQNLVGGSHPAHPPLSRDGDLFVLTIQIHELKDR
jgi:hypothetical protein